MTVALTLEGCSLALATISLPLAAPSPAQLAEEAAYDPEAAPDLLPAPLPPRCARLAATLAAVRALSSPALPFAALPAGTDALRVVVPKAQTAAVFKALQARQVALGVQVGAVKACVSLAPLPPAELEAAAAAGLVGALLHRGWHRLDEDRVLGASPLEPAADGGVVACSSLTLRVQAQPGEAPAGKLTLLVRAEHVEWRHPACRPLGAASLADRSAQLAGTPCCLLPDLRPALIEQLRPADEPTLARLRPLWAAYGQPLPEAVEQLLEVRLDCDPDAPTFPVPPCRVLGQDGLPAVAHKLSAPAVQAALARLRDDLAATPFKFLGPSLRLAPLAREWFPEGLPPARGRAALEQAAAAPLAFTTAREMVAAGKGDGDEGPQLHLDAELRVEDWAAGAEGGAGAGQQRQRRQYAPVPPALQAAFDEAKRLQAEAEKPAGPPRSQSSQKASAAPPVGAAAAAAKLPPLALRQAAVAAAGGSAKPGVPQFKRIAGAAAPTAKKGAAAGQKRAGAAKPPAAPKRPKAAAAAAAAPATALASAPPSAAAGGSQAGGSQAGLSRAAPSAAKPAAARAAAPASTAAEGGGMGAAAPAPKAPAKPRQKAADIDVAAVTAKVVEAHAAGTLSKLTIPELKAYLKGVKAPVGGKKGELEERVRQRLGGGGGGGGEGGAAGAPATAGAAMGTAAAAVQ